MNKKVIEFVFGVLGLVLGLVTTAFSIGSFTAMLHFVKTGESVWGKFGFWGYLWTVYGIVLLLWGGRKVWRGLLEAARNERVQAAQNVQPPRKE